MGYKGLHLQHTGCISQSQRSINVSCLLAHSVDVWSDGYKESGLLGIEESASGGRKGLVPCVCSRQGMDERRSLFLPESSTIDNTAPHQEVWFTRCPLLAQTTIGRLDTRCATWMCFSWCFWQNFGGFFFFFTTGRASFVVCSLCLFNEEVERDSREAISTAISANGVKTSSAELLIPQVEIVYTAPKSMSTSPSTTSTAHSGMVCQPRGDQWLGQVFLQAFNQSSC